VWSGFVGGSAFASGTRPKLKRSSARRVSRTQAAVEAALASRIEGPVQQMPSQAAVPKEHEFFACRLYAADRVFAISPSHRGFRMAEMFFRLCFARGAGRLIRAGQRTIGALVLHSRGRTALVAGWLLGPRQKGNGVPAAAQIRFLGETLARRVAHQAGFVGLQACTMELDSVTLVVRRGVFRAPSWLSPVTDRHSTRGSAFLPARCWAAAAAAGGHGAANLDSLGMTRTALCVRVPTKPRGRAGLREHD